MAEQQEIWEELKVEHQWFHIVRAMIMRGKIRDMGVNAWAVYTVLKAHTALDTGKSWPSQTTIANLLGISVDTVARATDVLIEMKIVTKTKDGNKNNYRLTEEIPMTSQEGELVALAQREYQPMAFMKFVDEIKAWAKDGNHKLDDKINIVMNINVINQGDNSTVNIQQISLNGDDVKSDDRMALLTKRLKGL